MEIINALARNTIDLHRAELILRALHIAVKNVRRAHFGFSADNMIKEVPTYPTPAKTTPTGNNADKHNTEASQKKPCASVKQPAKVETRTGSGSV
jgi:hypothetical protein